MIRDSYLIFSNGGEINDVAAQKIHRKMREYGWIEVFHREEASLIYCIGGDGALLRLIRRSKFPKAMIVGINTGHLGFFQEIPVEELDSFALTLRHKKSRARVLVFSNEEENKVFNITLCSM